MLSPVFTEYQGERFVFFSSPHSDNGCLSNWYESGFTLDARSFESAEQAFLYLKALSSGDEATALRVFAMDDPRYFARLNKQIRPYDARRWAQRREAAMRQIEHEKFVQSEELRNFLLATGDATIVNCSKNPLWSCGLQISQFERLDRDRWVGQNLLGTILMELREELRPPKPEPEPEPEPEQAAEPAPAEAEPDAKAEAEGPADGESAGTEEPTDGEDAGTEAPEPAEADVAAPDDATHAAADAPEEAASSTAGEAEPTEEAEGQRAEAAPEPAEATPAETAPSSSPSAAPSPQEDDEPLDEPDDQTGEDKPGAAAGPSVDAQLTELIPNPASSDETTVMADAELTELIARPEAEGGQGEDVPATDMGGTSQLPPVEERLAGSATTGEDGAQPPASPAREEDDPVARYQRGDYPTAAELADGSILKRLMDRFSHGDSPAVRQALMQCLRDSVVAVTAVKVDPVIAATAPVREDGITDPLIMDNGVTYRPSVLENDQGQRWFPAFSSAAEISDQISGQTSVIMLPMSQCVELARTQGGLAGIVVNVFTENLILPGRTCDYIAGLPSRAGGGEAVGDR